MATRRRAREFAVRALYAADIGQETGPRALAALWGALMDGMPDGLVDEAAATADEVEFARAIVNGVDVDGPALDAKIEGASTNWRLPRMPGVDRNILRVGVWELTHRDDVPAPVIINEALEIAKKFGGAESRAFVNGILDRIAKDVGRGRRA